MRKSFGPTKSEFRPCVHPLFTAVVLIMVLVAPMYAQYETASVLGFVHDKSGSAISGAKVTLENVSTGVSVTTATNPEGKYEFNGVRIGEYIVVAASEGFEKAKTPNFTVNVNARQRVDLDLNPGTVQQEIVVSGVVGQLETENSERGQVVSTRDVDNLPLNGRSYADLALLAPGVRKSVLENQTTSSREASFNVNGQRSELNNFLLDGLDNNAYGTSNQGFSNEAIPPSPDAISEFKVETNNYDAEYGRASGAVVNVSIRSGTNDFHGKVWEYNRNTDFNAIGPFLPPKNANGSVQKPVLNRNQFGGAFGGPIFKDRTFFFADFEGVRQSTRQVATATVPTAAQRAGTFVDSHGNPIQLRNPITGQSYNGQVPVADMTDFAKGVLAALPLPNMPNLLSNNLISLPLGTINDNKGDVRVDHVFTERTNSFFRYSQHEGDIADPPAITGPAGGNSNGNVRIANRQVVGAVTHALSNSTLIDARIGFTWTEGGKTPYNQTAPSLMTGITGLPTDPLVVRALNVQNVTSFSAFGAQGSNPQFQNPFVINPKVNFSMPRGRHSLKFGYEYQSIATTIDDFNPVFGEDDYNGGFSFVSGSTSDTAIREAVFLTDFMTGARSKYQLNDFAIVDYQQRMHFAYVQDDIKLLPNLTFNIGVRYEYATPQWVSNNHLANFDPTTKTLIQAKSGGIYDRSLVHPRTNDFAPRIGIAYSITPNTVVRAGYGTSYIEFNREGGENLLAYNGPNIVNAAITQAAPFPATTSSLPLCTSNTQDPTTCFRTTQQGYPPNFAAAQNFSTLKAQTRYIPNNIPTGYSQNWHLTVQRELAKNTVLDVGYVGGHGVHLWTLADLNQAAPNQQTATCNFSVTPTVTSGCLSLQARRPISTFTGIEESIPAGYLIYHALQAEIEHRYQNGLYLLNSFTWSKAIDNVSGHLEAVNGDNSRVNLANLAGERAVSSYDQPLNDTLSVVWDLPVGKGHPFLASAPAWAQAIFGGWQINAINQMTSGLPVNLTYTEPAAFDVSDLLAYRPNQTGNPVLPSSQRTKTSTSLKYLNPTAVSVPTNVAQPYGTAGRNSVRGLPFYQLDTGLHKSFLLGEGGSMDFRAEAFNVFNKSNYFTPDGNASNGTFGQITQAFPARQLQLALKLVF